MRGVILAGGTGSRLSPITEVTNKHLLPVYDRPMIFHPLGTLLQAGIEDILIVTSPEHAGAFIRLLKNGAAFNARFTFRVQEGSGGIAEALGLAEDFAHGENLAVILGDNVFADDFCDPIQAFRTERGTKLFLKETEEAHRFGVAELNGDKLIGIEEKPAQPKSNFAITGLYLYDSQVFEVIKNLTPSQRNELEITDVNNFYVKKGQAQAVFVKGDWTDAGTFESLFNASTIARQKLLNQLSKHQQDRVLQGLKLQSSEHKYPTLTKIAPNNVHQS